MKERDHYENLEVDGKILEKGDMDWIYLAHDRGKWRAIVKRDINLKFP
jgi:hypothetical protein